MRRLPASASRAQAVKEIEPILLDTFQRFSKAVPHDTRDAMHYGLFSVADRFAASAAWLIAPRLGISRERWSQIGCALELIHCGIEFKTRRNATEARDQRRFVEPAFAEAAAYGLIPMAFEVMLSGDSNPTAAERMAIAIVVAKHISPMALLTASHREARLTHERHNLSISALKEAHHEKISPLFEASGAALEILAPSPPPAGALHDWLGSLGLLAHWIGELDSSHPSPLALAMTMAMPEAMDLIKSLEVELLARATTLGFRDAAHDLIEPLAEVLRTRLQ